jgi:dihydrolipoamide dehydrogenase
MVVGSLTVETDVVVIGAGPGGYVAAIRAAQLGFEVMVIDSQKGLGGVCLQEGCIPTKALISASDYVHVIQNIQMMGIDVQNYTLNPQKMVAWKQGVIDKMDKGIQNLFTKHGIEVINGKAEFTDANTIHISGQSDINVLKFKHAIIATGSLPIDIPGFPIDGKYVVGSKEALSPTVIPKSVVIIGGGYIGTELSTVLGKLGAQVHLFEMGDRLIPMLDAEIVSVVQKKISKFGVVPHFNVKAQNSQINQDKGTVTVTYLEENQTKTIDVEQVIVVVGRKPNTTILGLEKIGIELDAHKFIPVNEKMQTKYPHIFAVGDVAGQPMLAHKAERQGKVAAEVIAGLPSAYDNKVCPSVVFNDPELMSVGMTLEQAKAAGFDAIESKFPLTALAKSYFVNPASVEGFVKMVIENKTGIILGCHGVGPKVSEIVSEVTFAIEMGATAEDIGNTIHPHPTMSESIMEVADVVLGRSVHIFKEKKKE